MSYDSNLVRALAPLGHGVEKTTTIFNTATTQNKTYSDGRNSNGNESASKFNLDL